jgi:hypothetical protein
MMMPSRSAIVTVPVLNNGLTGKSLLAGISVQTPFSGAVVVREGRGSEKECRQDGSGFILARVSAFTLLFFTPESWSRSSIICACSKLIPATRIVKILMRRGRSI